jgi:hypothetical protein
VHGLRRDRLDLAGAGRIRTGRFEVSNLDKQTFAHIPTAAGIDPIVVRWLITKAVIR